MSEFRKPNDNWPAKIADRASVCVRFVERPIGTVANENFIEFVRRVTQRNFPSPICTLNCPLSSKPLQDTRLVFASAEEANEAANILIKADFRKLKIVDIVFVDLVASSLRLSNDNVRVSVTQLGDQKVMRTLGQEGTPTINFTKNDPYKKHLESLDQRAATPPNTAPTPRASPARGTAEKRGGGDSSADEAAPETKKSSSGRRSSAPAEVSVEAIGDKVDLIKQQEQNGSVQREEESNGGMDTPSSKEEAERRAAMLNKQVSFLRSLPAEKSADKLTAASEELRHVDYLLEQYALSMDAEMGWSWAEMCDMIA